MADITPYPISDAFAEYREYRQKQKSAATVRNENWVLTAFQDFLERREIEHLNEITNFHLHKFTQFLQNRDKAYATRRNNLSNIRTFLRYWAKKGFVEGATPERIPVPESGDPRLIKEDTIEPERAHAALEYYNKYEYASRNHTIFQLLWHTQIRVGTLVGFDLEDWEPRDRHLHAFHRPDTGTTLKNRNEGQRAIKISEEVASLLNDYIEFRRHTIADSYDRNPLFTTKHGRVSRNTVRKNIYAITRPCVTQNHCPHDRNPNTCEAAQYKKKASKCPSSRSTHPIRKGSITHALNNDFPKEHLSIRADVSVDVLDRHYDMAKEKRKSDRQDKYLDRLD
jgi:site-specific recombinase XerD